MPTTTKYISKLANKRILVLGGTSGIGFAVAEACVEHGAIVTVASHTQAKLDKAVQRLQTAYPEYKDHILSCNCDVGDVSRIEENVVAALKHAAGDGKIDHIVVTAGAAGPRPKLADVTVEMLQGRDDKVVTSIMLAKHAQTYMNVTPSSSLTWTSGTLVDKPTPDAAIMGGVGAALNGLAKGLAIALKPVRANVVSPGLIDTEMVRGYPGAEGFIEYFKGQTLTGTVGMPEDTAEAYLYLMRDRFVTGTVVRTDGGRLLV